MENWYLSVIERKPFMYWIINTVDLEASFGPDSFKLVYEESDTRDKCHLVIYGLTNNQGKNFVKAKCTHPYIYLCVDDDCKQLTSEEIKDLDELL